MLKIKKVMSIDIKIISQLRERTGAGLSDCKSALLEADGDLEKAIEVLRKKGEIKTAKKSGREANEGAVALALGAGKAAAIVLSCETDFAARSEDFISAADNFAQELLETENLENFKNWAEEKIKTELVVKIGENIKLSDFAVVAGQIIGSYLHFNKKTAGVVILTGQGEKLKELADVLALQVVAMSPKYLRPEDVPPDIVEKEKEIYREQLKQAGKPENIWDKIIAGKLSKFYEEICLLNQPYVKEEEKKISDLIKEAGEGVAIKEFRRFQV